MDSQNHFCFVCTIALSPSDIETHKSSLFHIKNVEKSSSNYSILQSVNYVLPLPKNLKTIFKCKECEATFKSSTGALHHISLHHNKISIVQELISDFPHPNTLDDNIIKNPGATENTNLGQLAYSCEVAVTDNVWESNKNNGKSFSENLSSGYDEKHKFLHSTSSQFENNIICMEPSSKLNVDPDRRNPNYCEMCSCDCITSENYLHHISGKKHAKKRKNMDVVHSAISQSQPQWDRSLYNWKSSIPKPPSSQEPPPLFYCNICKVSANSKTAIDQHRSGVKHFKMEKKYNDNPTHKPPPPLDRFLSQPVENYYNQDDFHNIWRS